MGITCLWMLLFVVVFLNSFWFLPPGRWTCDMCGMCASCLRRSPGEGNTSRWKHEVCGSTVIFYLHRQYIINQQGDENNEMYHLENNVFMYMLKSCNFNLLDNKQRWWLKIRHCRFMEDRLTWKPAETGIGVLPTQPLDTWCQEPPYVPRVNPSPYLSILEL